MKAMFSLKPINKETDLCRSHLNVLMEGLPRSGSQEAFPAVSDWGQTERNVCPVGTGFQPLSRKVACFK